MVQRDESVYSVGKRRRSVWGFVLALVVTLAVPAVGFAVLAAVGLERGSYGLRTAAPVHLAACLRLLLPFLEC